MFQAVGGFPFQGAEPAGVSTGNSTEVRAKAIAPTWSQGCSLLHCEVGLWEGVCVGLDEIVM